MIFLSSPGCDFGATRDLTRGGIDELLFWVSDAISSFKEEIVICCQTANPVSAMNATNMSKLFIVLGSGCAVSWPNKTRNFPFASSVQPD
jgi:hypothetical protein